MPASVKATARNDSSRPRVLLLIPSRISPDEAEQTASGERPRSDYMALRAGLNADILDYSALDGPGLPRLARAAMAASRDAALAALGYARRADYDIIFCNAENIGIPLGLLLKTEPDLTRPGLVMIGHRLSAPKKRLLLRTVRPQVDAMFVYSRRQLDFVLHKLGYHQSVVFQIPFHADERFFGPQITDGSPRQVCSAGMERRDYATLIAAAQDLDVDVRIGAHSPWRHGRSSIDWRTVPQNITAAQYSYAQLRRLYAESAMVVVPVVQTDFQAGITTILEAMAMGKAVISTRTAGMADAITDGENGILTPPGDSSALRDAISSLLNSPRLAERLGKRARSDFLEWYTLDLWVERISKVIEGVYHKKLCTAG